MSFEFNVNNYSDEGSYDLIPEGEYTVIINNAEERTSQSTGKKYINIEYEIMGGDYDGRKLFIGYFPNSDNPKAVQMTNRAFFEICAATGLKSFTLDSLLNKKLRAKVSIKPAKDGYEASNSIKKYSPIDGKGWSEEEKKELLAQARERAKSQAPATPKEKKADWEV